MTGYVDDNRRAFRAAAAEIRSRFPGVFVVSPDELDNIDPPKGPPTWEANLTRDIPHLVRCDMVIALPGWEDSKGALLETCIMSSLSKPVLRWPSLEIIPRSGLPVPSLDAERWDTQ